MINDFVLGRPRLVIALTLLIGLLCASGAGGLQFNADYRAFFAEDNPDLVALKALEKRFSRADTLVMAVAPADGQVFTVERLAVIRQLTDAWSRLPYAKGASSISNYIEARSDGDDLLAEPLLPDDLAGADLAAIQQRAKTDERLRGGLLSQTGDIAGLYFYFELPRAHPREELNAIGDAVRAEVAKVQAAHPDLRIALGGVLMFDEAMQKQLLRDSSTLYPLCFLVMTVLLYGFFRSASATFATLVAMTLASAMTFGLAGWAKLALNPASLTAGVIILTISIADAVHLLTTFAAERAQGAEPRAAMAASLRINGRTIFLTTLVNALGFLSMNFSNSPPYRELGNLVAIGTLLAWLLSVSFVAAWTQLWPPRVSPSALKQVEFIKRFIEWVIGRWKLVLPLSAVIIAGLSAGIALNRFGDNYVEFFTERVAFRTDTEFINQRLAGMQFIEYAVEAGGPGDVFEPAFLSRVEDFSTWLKQQPEVRRVASLNDIAKRLNKAMHGDDPAEFKLPASREEAAQHLLFYEMSLPSGQDLTHLVDLDKSAIRLTVLLNTISSSELEAFDQRAQAWVTSHWPETMKARSSGISALFAKIARSNFQSMGSGMLTSCALIAGLLIWLSRSFKLGLISLLPNLTPILVGFGIWGLSVGKMGMSLAVVASLTLGIVVDDTMHVFSHYGAARRRGATPVEALREAYADVGAALWVTSATLVIGFSVLAFSNFLLTVHLGLLTSLILALALVAEFVLTPTLLLWLDREPSRSP